MDYQDINRESWNTRTEKHLSSEFYDLEGFFQHRNSLNLPELERWPDIQGKSLLHLQCHFGQDTLSWAEKGAIVTGVDLSDRAIDRAKELAEKMQLPARFICSDVYDLPDQLHERFDLVFTSYGVLGWLPDMDRWGKTVSHFLKPGGELLLIEFHPALWMFDDDFERIVYSYFNAGEIRTEEGSYTEDAPSTKETFVTWNHSLSEVTKGLLQNGMEIVELEEYDYSCYDCFNRTVKTEKGYQIKGMEGKLPMMYSVRAKKQG